MKERMLQIFLNSVMKSLGEKIDAVLIMDRDDKVVVQLLTPSLPPLKETAISTLISSNLTKISDEFDGDTVGTFAFSTDLFRLVFSEAGSEAILVLIAPSGSNLDLLFSYIYLCAEKIARINMGATTSFLLPDLEDITSEFPSIAEIQRITLDSGAFLMKVILGGDSGVGKTTIVEKFVSDTFKNDFKSTIGVNLMKRTISYRNWNIDVTFSVFDMGGQEQFAEVRKNYYIGARAGFIVFDVTQYESFQNVERWCKEVREVEPAIMLVIVGNKVDLVNERKVSKAEGKALGKKLGFKYLETSALNQDFVEEAFRTLGFLYILKNRVINIIQK